MAKFAGLQDPITLDFENSTIAYCVDAFSISMGALMGTSPVTTFVESATGIRGMADRFCIPQFNNISRRGRENGHHRDGRRTGLLGLCLLRADIFVHTWLGDRWGSGVRRLVDDAQVRVSPTADWHDCGSPLSTLVVCAISTGTMLGTLCPRS